MRNWLIGLLLFACGAATGQNKPARLTIINGELNYQERGSSVNKPAVDLSLRGYAATIAVVRSAAFSATAQTVTITDALRGGTFRRDDLDTSTPDDGVLVLVNLVTGKRYKRELHKQELTPFLYGAVPGDAGDDSAALLAWLNATGRTLSLPEGDYIYNSNTPLLRTNKGGVIVVGAGSARTTITFSGSAGMGLTNPVGGNLGLLSVSGVRLVCGSAKPAGTAGLLLTSQHEAQPGVVMTDVKITSDGTYEWPVPLHLHDCSYTSYKEVYINGKNLNTGTVGVKITNTANGATGRPAVNYNLAGINVLACDTALVVDCKGSPGIEGVNVIGFRAVAVRAGIVARTRDYAATWISFDQTHVENFDAEALSVTGYSQVQFGGTDLWYTHGSPARAILFKNVIGVTGDIGHVVTFDAVGYAVEFAGTSGQCGNVGLVSFRHTYDDQSTGDLKVGAAYSGSRIHYHGAWSGLKGTANPQRYVDLSGTSELTGSAEAAQTAGLITGGNLDLRAVYGKFVTLSAGQTGPITSVSMRYGQQCTLRFSTPLTVQSNTNIWLTGRSNRAFRANESLTLYRSVDNVEEVGRGSLPALKLQYVSATATIDPTVGNVVQVDNGATAVTLSIDYTKLTLNETFYVKAFTDNSSGPITIQTTNPAVNFVQDADGALKSSLTLYGTETARTWGFIWDGTHLELLSGGIHTGGLVTVTANRDITVADWGKVLKISSANVVLTVQAGLPDKFYCLIQHNNVTGTTTVNGAAGVSVNFNSGYNKVTGTPSGFGAARLQRNDPNWFGLSGNVSN